MRHTSNHENARNVGTESVFVYFEFTRSMATTVCAKGILPGGGQSPKPRIPLETFGDSRIAAQVSDSYRKEIENIGNGSPMEISIGGDSPIFKNDRVIDDR